MTCTPIPKGLHIVGDLIVCDSDWRVWEAPPERKKLVYDEVTGDVLAGEYRCKRVFPQESE